jgi:hypothetical protein
MPAEPAQRSLWQIVNGSPVLQGQIVFGGALVVVGLQQALVGRGSQHLTGPLFTALGAFIIATILFRYHPAGVSNPRWSTTRARRSVRAVLYNSWRAGVVLGWIAVAYAVWDWVR